MRPLTKSPHPLGLICTPINGGEIVSPSEKCRRTQDELKHMTHFAGQVATTVIIIISFNTNPENWGSREPQNTPGCLWPPRGNISHPQAWRPGHTRGHSLMKGTTRHLPGVCKSTNTQPRGSLSDSEALYPTQHVTTPSYLWCFTADAGKAGMLTLDLQMRTCGPRDSHLGPQALALGWP